MYSDNYTAQFHKHAVTHTLCFHNQTDWKWHYSQCSSLNSHECTNLYSSPQQNVTDSVTNSLKCNLTTQREHNTAAFDSAKLIKKTRSIYTIVDRDTTCSQLLCCTSNLLDKRDVVTFQQYPSCMTQHDNHCLLLFVQTLQIHGSNKSVKKKIQGSLDNDTSKRHQWSVIHEIQ